jgi:hypothetical protein
MHSKETEQQFKFTKNQLVSMLHGTIELYRQYRIASGMAASEEAAIIEVLQGLEADKQLAGLGVAKRGLQL